ncbi:MAG: hypothetical protein CL917_16315 [Deltaproteobacteria bacterium]|nr:hypothetical protein [Deltaproteobacteria bacterium]
MGHEILRRFDRGLSRERGGAETAYQGVYKPKRTARLREKREVKIRAVTEGQKSCPGLPRGFIVD